MTDIETIKAAIKNNRGGWDGATDGEFLDLWKMLDEPTRAAYLASLTPLAGGAALTPEGGGGSHESASPPPAPPAPPAP